MHCLGIREPNINEIVRLYIEENKTTRQIASQFGISKWTIQDRLKKAGINLRTRPKIEFEIGKGIKGTFWTPLERIVQKVEQGTIISWLCRCICGKTSLVNNQCLKNKKSVSCGCSRLNYTGIKNLSGAYLNKVKLSSKRRGLEFNLSKEYLLDLIEKSNFTCNLSGLNIELVKNYQKYLGRQTASVDRIDSSKGYIEGNIQWVHKDINFIKWELNQSDFVSICERISLYKGIEVDPDFKEDDLILLDKPYPSHYSGYKDLSGQYFRALKDGAKDRNLSFTITKEQLWSKYVEQQGICYLSGIKLTLLRNYSERAKLQTASVDRVNNEEGYTLNNIAWVYKPINFMRINYTLDYFKFLCSAVAKHQFSIAA